MIPWFYMWFHDFTCDFMISVVISWFRLWFHDFMLDFALSFINSLRFNMKTIDFGCMILWFQSVISSKISWFCLVISCFHLWFHDFKCDLIDFKYDFMISVVISWFQLWFHDFSCDFMISLVIPWFCDFDSWFLIPKCNLYRISKGDGPLALFLLNTITHMNN